jgi:hypothetical protein
MNDVNNLFPPSHPIYSNSVKDRVKKFENQGMIVMGNPTFSKSPNTSVPPSVTRLRSKSEGGSKENKLLPLTSSILSQPSTPASSPPDPHVFLSLRQTKNLTLEKPIEVPPKIRERVKSFMTERNDTWKENSEEEVLVAYGTNLQKPILKEILKTERDYTRNLDDLKTVGLFFEENPEAYIEEFMKFFNGYERRKVTFPVNADVINSILIDMLGNIKTLRTTTFKLYGELTNAPDVKSIAQAFIDADLAFGYTFMSTLKERYEKLNQQTSKHLSKFLTTILKDVNPQRKQDFDSLTIAPIQHLARYPLLLEKLIDATNKELEKDPNNPERLLEIQSLTTALKGVKKVTEIMNSASQTLKSMSNIDPSIGQRPLATSYNKQPIRKTTENFS